MKSFFYFTKSELKGLLLLLTVVFFLVLLFFILPFFQTEHATNHEDFKEQLAAFEETIVMQEAAAPKYPRRYQKKYEQKKQENEPEEILVGDPFPFDPNKSSFEELLALGLSQRAAHSVLNYREKGGQFRQKSDFSKIYTLSAANFERLESFILLPDSLERKTNYKKRQQTSPGFSTPVRLDVNRATAEDFQQLRGIGPSFAKRIVKYRKALGGFASSQQIAEVYGLPDSTFMAIQPLLICNNQNINTLNINAATVDELKAHPYLRWKHAKAIVRYRDINGPYSDIEILRTFFEFDDGQGTYWKILPYLSI